MRQQLIIQTILTLFFSARVMAVTCVPPDWNDLCKLGVDKEERCASVNNFKYICSNQTAGCDSVPGGCFGAIPPGNWYPVAESNGGEVKFRCRCGCFAESTVFGDSELISGSELIALKDLNESSQQLRMYGIRDLDSDRFVINNINGIMNSKKGQEVIKLIAGDREIILSDSHPVVLGDENGKIISIVTASQVKPGDFLVDSNRRPVSVTSVKLQKYRGSLMNFNVVSQNPLEHIVIANGFLMGDLAWQTYLHSTESRLIYRKDMMLALGKEVKNGKN